MKCNSSIYFDQTSIKRKGFEYASVFGSDTSSNVAHLFDFYDMFISNFQKFPKTVSECRPQGDRGLEINAFEVENVINDFASYLQDEI